MTFAEVEQLWVDNGGNATYAPIMAAIAFAESGGDPNAIGDYGTSNGLWQVHFTVHPQFNPSSLFQPNYNAQAAIQLSGNGLSLSPWTTFNTGAYKRYLPGGSGFTQGTPSSSSTTQTQTSTSSSGTSTGLDNIFNKIPIVGGAIEGIASETIVLIGAVTFIFIGGLWIIFGNQDTRKVFVGALKDTLV